MVLWTLWYKEHDPIDHMAEEANKKPRYVLLVLKCLFDEDVSGLCKNINNGQT